MIDHVRLDCEVPACVSKAGTSPLSKTAVRDGYIELCGRYLVVGLVLHDDNRRSRAP